MSALKDYQERTKKEVERAISELHTTGHYLKNKADRILLAELYLKVNGLRDGFPIANFITAVPRTLKKDVSESCPACVKSAVMTKTIDEAIKDLRNYALLLNGIEPAKIEEPKTIHELRPNIDFQ